MKLDERVLNGLAQLRESSGESWQPSHDLAASAVARVRRRRRLSVVAAAGVVSASAVTVGLLGSPGGGGRSEQVTVQPADHHASSSLGPRRVDFTVSYLPPGFRYFNEERGPTNVFVDVTRRYHSGAGGDVATLFVTAQYGKIMTLAEYRKFNGPLRDISVGGHPAVIGWNTGQPGQGLNLLYVILGPYTAVEVSERPGLSSKALTDGVLVKVAASVSVSTSGSPYTQVTVPDVIGDTQQAAADAIAAAGLGVGSAEYDYAGHASVPPEHVMRQEPAPGSIVTSGSLVNLVLAPK